MRMQGTDSMHKVDEYVPIEDVVLLVELYREFMSRFYAQPAPG